MNEALERAVKLFNQGKYLEASEHLERISQDAEQPLKEIASVLNRVAAALHLRFNRGSYQGSINLLSQALFAVEEIEMERYGIDREQLKMDLARMVEEIRSAGRERSGLKHQMRLFVERRRAPKIKLYGTAGFRQKD
jgi:predicted metal-dependent hydrolase